MILSVIDLHESIEECPALWKKNFIQSKKEMVMCVYIEGEWPISKNDSFYQEEYIFCTFVYCSYKQTVFEFQAINDIHILQTLNFLIRLALGMQAFRVKLIKNIIRLEGRNEVC